MCTIIYTCILLFVDGESNNRSLILFLIFLFNYADIQIRLGPTWLIWHYGSRLSFKAIRCGLSKCKKNPIRAWHLTVSNVACKLSKNNL